MNREQAITRLKAQEAELRKAGLSALYLFGSVVRGEERADSDLDLACDIDDQSKMDLITFAGIMIKLEEKLATKVDLVPLRSMRPRIKARVEQEMVKVF
jgi:uncharacterized protein